MSAHAEGRASGAFSPEESRLHEEGFARIRAGLEAGLGFDEACRSLDVADSCLCRVIVDDFLKVTIAEEHFNAGRSTAEVAEKLGLPVERVNRAREEMIAEVASAAVEVFRRQSGTDNPS